MKGVNAFIGMLIIAALPLGLGAWFMHSQLTYNATVALEKSISTVRDTTHLAVKTWFKNHKSSAIIWANTPTIQQAAIDLLSLPSEKKALSSSKTQQTLREWFRPIQKATDYQDYFIVGPEYTNLASSRDQNIGDKNVLLKQEGFMPRIWSGEAKVSLPTVSDVTLGTLEMTTSMFVACPIFNASGDTIAIFMFRLNPEKGFTNLLQQGRIGITGETYAFDNNARLISQSPLTLIASSAIKHGTGTNLTGYPDYRGVPVVGAWLWDDELELGIATELDKEEAFHSLYDTQFALNALTALLFSLLLGTIAISILLRQRNRAVNITQIEQEKLRAYFDTANTLIVALDHLGKITLINKTAFQVLGYEESELIGLDWFNVGIPKSEQAAVYKTFQGLMSGENKGVEYYENMILTRTGESRCIAWHNTVLKDKEGSITGTLSSGNDITEKKQMKEKLSKSERMFRLLIESVGKDYLIYQQNVDEKFQYLSPSCEHFTGMAADQAVGLHTNELFDVTAQARQIVDDSIARLKRGETVSAFEASYTHPDSSIRTVEVISRLEQNDDKTVAFVGIVKDVTLQKNLDEELKRAAIVFDNTNEGIIVTDANTKILLANNAFSKVTGYGLDEIRGKSPRFMSSGKHDNDFYQAMNDTLRREGHWGGEIWNRRKNGEIYPVWENINVVKNDQGVITNFIAILSDISQLKSAEERLNYLAHHDALTTLPNRLHFQANLEQAIKGAKRHQRKIALLFLDLDKFKHINDTLGHDAGDQLLKVVADRLRLCVRAEDTVARMGGDEFTILLMDVARTEYAGLIADKVVKAISQPVTINGDIVHPSASVGIGLYPDDAEDSDALIKAADTAMYNAKARGRNNLQFFTSGQSESSVENALIEKGLCNAMENNEFELYYQPQIRLSDGVIEGVEALIRWNHPDRGLLLPEGFIRIADDSNLIDDISEWVLRSALNDLASWSLNSRGRLRIALNMTARQIAKASSLQRILNVIEELGPDPETLQIDLEISEAGLYHIESTVGIMNKLKERGVMISISDFGKGPLSLSLIKKLPIDTLKINQDLIHDMEDGDGDITVASAIVAMAHSLGIRVIGEGVETKRQLEALQKMNCDEIQGFYCCKPVPAKEITPLLNKSIL